MRRFSGKILCLLLIGVLLGAILPACTQSASNNKVEIIIKEVH